MGMRISSSSSSSSTQATTSTNWQQRQQSMKSLFSALQSGDLGAAQKAYASLTSGSATINPNSALGQIGQDLQSGDLAGAQKTAQAMQAHHGGHHHHHGGGGQPTQTQTAAVGSNPTSSTGSAIDLLA